MQPVHQRAATRDDLLFRRSLYDPPPSERVPRFWLGRLGGVSTFFRTLGGICKSSMDGPAGWGGRGMSGACRFVPRAEGGGAGCGGRPA